MPSYVAFLRGINSGQNPAQKMDNLRRIFEGLGFQRVQTVIASGNVLFENGPADRTSLEERIEKALLSETGIATIAIIRTLGEISDLISRDPFGQVKVSPTMKLYATFLKTTPATRQEVPGKGTGYTIIAILDTRCLLRGRPLINENPDADAGPRGRVRERYHDTELGYRSEDRLTVGVLKLPGGFIWNLMRESGRSLFQKITEGPVHSPDSLPWPSGRSGSGRRRRAWR